MNPACDLVFLMSLTPFLLHCVIDVPHHNWMQLLTFLNESTCVPLYLYFCTWYSCEGCLATECQKKLITSLSTWHSLNSTASKWFIFGHRLGTMLSLTCTSEKHRVYFNQRGDKCPWNRKRYNFLKSQKLLDLKRAGSSKHYNSPYGIYVTCHMKLDE